MSIEKATTCITHLRCDNCHKVYKSDKIFLDYKELLFEETQARFDYNGLLHLCSKCFSQRTNILKKMRGAIRDEFYAGFALCVFYMITELDQPTMAINAMDDHGITLKDLKGNADDADYKVIKKHYAIEHRGRKRGG